MKSFRKWLALGLALVLLLSLWGCKKEGEELPEETKPEKVSAEESLREKIKLDSYEVITDELGYAYLVARVSMPDFISALEANLEKAESKAKSEKDFEDVLFELALKSLKGAKADQTVTVTVNLTDLKPNREADAWTKSQLTAAARQQAFDDMILEFCAGLVLRAAGEE